MSFLISAGNFGVVLFFTGLILTHKKNYDGREMYLSYKINTYEGMLLALVMAVIYLKFPSLNWFHAFISFGLIIRGIVGLLAFRFN